MCLQKGMYFQLRSNSWEVIEEKGGNEEVKKEEEGEEECGISNLEGKGIAGGFRRDKYLKRLRIFEKLKMKSFYVQNYCWEYYLFRLR